MSRLAYFFQTGLAVLLLFLASGHVLADEVILENGDRLSGKIVEVKDGFLTLQTSYSEPIKLKFDAVQQMNSSEPVEVHLTDGEILKGKISSDKDGQLQVAPELAKETVVIKLADVAALNPPPKKPATWKGNITVGGNWQDGNTDTLSVSVGGLAVRRSENDRFTMNFLYNLTENEGERTAENTYGQLKYDYFLNPVWYVYLNIDMLSDEFKDIKLRTSVGPGVGYQIWDEEDRALNLEAGVSYTSQDRDQGEDTDWLAARLAANLLYRLFDSIVFTDQFVIYPDLDNTGEYTLRNEASIGTELGASWSLKLSNIWERDSDPGPDAEPDDFTWILGMQYSF